MKAYVSFVVFGKTAYALKAPLERKVVYRTSAIEKLVLIYGVYAFQKIARTTE